MRAQSYVLVHENIGKRTKDTLNVNNFNFSSIDALAMQASVPLIDMKKYRYAYISMAYSMERLPLRSRVVFQPPPPILVVLLVRRYRVTRATLHGRTDTAQTEQLGLGLGIEVTSGGRGGRGGGTSRQNRRAG